MNIILTGNPQSTNNLYRRGRSGMYMTEAGHDLKTDYHVQAMQQYNRKPLDGPVHVQILIYFGDKKKRDIDNYNKILLDSLTGVVYKDDSQIEEMFVKKDYDKKNPRIVINVCSIIEKY